MADIENAGAVGAWRRRREWRAAQASRRRGARVAGASIALVLLAAGLPLWVLWVGLNLILAGELTDLDEMRTLASWALWAGIGGYLAELTRGEA